MFEKSDRVITEDKPRPVICSWFLLCQNKATRIRQHPTLGGVPICQSCDELIARLQNEGFETFKVK